MVRLGTILIFWVWYWRISNNVWILRGSQRNIILYIYIYPPTPAGGSAPEKPGLCEFACCNLSSRSLCMSAVSGALGGPQQDLEDLQSLGPLGVHSVTCCTLSPIFMHSLGDVWHLGSEDLESLQLLGPSLQDLQDLQSLGPLGVHSVICCTLSSYLYAFLRWRLASWLWGSGVSAASGSLSARSGGSAVSGALGGPQCHFLHSFFLSLCIP